MTTKLKVMENGLVPVYETDAGEKVVYGTELHKFLGVRSNYRDWIRNRLHDCEAVEKEDYEPAKILSPSGQTKNEHIIKLDLAKEMSMLERNEKGKQVRRYFIQVEKKYNAIQKAVLEQMAEFVERQEEFNRTVMKKLELIESDGSRRLPGMPFLSAGDILEERMEILNCLVDEVSELCGIERNRVLHYMYKELQEHLGTSLNPYLSVMKSENRRKNICNLHVIASVDRFYEKAVEMNRFVIDRKKLYG